MRHLNLLIFVLIVISSTHGTELSTSCSAAISDDTYTNTQQYYQSLLGLSGEALRQQLHIITKKNHVYNFDYAKCTWDLLSNIDSANNLLQVNSEHVLTLYARKLTPICAKNSSSRYSCSDATQPPTSSIYNHPDTWNREHIWSQSHGFKGTNTPPHNDLHHLRAADRSVNTAKSEDDFDWVAQLEQYAVNDCKNCYEDERLDLWMPAPDARGDVARAMFYMDIRYDPDDSVDLRLVNGISADGSAEYGNLCTLLEWHILYPVSDLEKRRNESVYLWQGNRNPFVDMPDLAKEIFGQACTF